MNMIDAILQEFVHEAGATRRMLERAPMDKRDWRPHPKSMTLGRLAAHIAEIPTYVRPILDQDELVMDPAKHTSTSCTTSAELLKAFDDNMTAATRAMSGISDGHLMKTWRFTVGDRVIFEMPRIAVLRAMVLSHNIHHRGQLSVFLRLNDVPLPQVYGPTADEAMG